MKNPVQERIINAILEREGEKYTNDPKDSGGPTKWGITEKRARASGYKGDMRNLTRAEAYDIYVKEYWDVVWADKMPSPALQDELVDTAVNCGPGNAIEFLQRSLNAFNQQGTLWPDLVVDGGIGSRTLAAVLSYYKHRDEIVLLRSLNSLQGAYYIGLTVRRPKDERFSYGWFMHRIVI